MRWLVPHFLNVSLVEERTLFANEVIYYAWVVLKAFGTHLEKNLGCLIIEEIVVS